MLLVTSITAIVDFDSLLKESLTGSSIEIFCSPDFSKLTINKNPSNYLDFLPKIPGNPSNYLENAPFVNSKENWRRKNFT